VKGGGHVTSAAILDFRIFPEKSEEKKDIKNLCQNYFFNWNPWTNKQVIKNKVNIACSPP
jgi:hypothetical protein